MKSPQVQQAKHIPEGEKANYSDLKVLRSLAGYYVGTTYFDGVYEEPGSRDSIYFSTREKATEFLKQVEAGIAKTRKDI